MAWDSSSSSTDQSDSQTLETIPNSVLICVPHRGWFDAYHHIAWSRFIVKLCMLRIEGQPLQFDAIWESGSRPLALTRNIMISSALNRGFEAIFWVDSDTELQQNTLQKLLQVKRDIVSACYFNRAPPHDPVAIIQGKPLPRDELGTEELLYVDAVGLGACLITRNVLIKMGQNLAWRCLKDHPKDISWEEAASMKWMCPQHNELLVANYFDHRHGFESGPENLSEDYHFFTSARKLGFKVCLRADTFVGHTSLMKITREGIETEARLGMNTT